MSSETSLALRAHDLSKKYRIYAHPRDRLFQALWRSKQTRFQEFWALQPLNLELKRGRTLGIVGRNGSGKSTLLQLICGTLTPTTGSVETHGRIGALLELGSGFNPEFSGRENVYLNASLLGLRRTEIDQQIDDILAFADIGDFIDQPVKTYSSGMAVRLAFGVQAHINPDLLVVDEALAVGDELFQKKCYAYIEKLKENGTSILLVTHSCPQIIQHCDEALLLHKGRSRMLGKPATVTVIYQRLINAPDDEWDRTIEKQHQLSEKQQQPKPAAAEQKPAEDGESAPKLIFKDQPIDTKIEAWLDTNLRPDSTVIYPDLGARIEELRIHLLSGEEVNHIPFGKDFSLSFDYFASEEVKEARIGCHIASNSGLRITGQNYPAGEASISHISAGTLWTLTFYIRGCLWPGLYFVGGGIWVMGAKGHQYLHRVIDFKAIRILAPSTIPAIGACNLSLKPPLIKRSQPAAPDPSAAGT
jgi:lipopolysaccharide transport system ATP-binding protein